MLEFVAQAQGLELNKIPEMASRLGAQLMQMGMGATPAFQTRPGGAARDPGLPLRRRPGLRRVDARRPSPGPHVDELFKSPPDSTEQIMHPGKYLEPRGADPGHRGAAASLAGYKVARRDVLGEMVFRIWFSGKLGEQGAERAAAGWGGDRMVAYLGPARRKTRCRW